MTNQQKAQWLARASGIRALTPFFAEVLNRLDAVEAEIQTLKLKTKDRLDALEAEIQKLKTKEN